MNIWGEDKFTPAHHVIGELHLVRVGVGVGVATCSDGCVSFLRSTQGKAGRGGETGRMGWL